MLFYLKTALDKLSQTNKSSNGDKKNTAEYVWFMKIGESKGPFTQMIFVAIFLLLMHAIKWIDFRMY